jgi:hypothetical protein
MFATLKSTKHSSITLGELRHFINNNCRSLSDDTPIDVCNTSLEDFDSNCTTIIADDESVTFYNS